MARAQLKAAWTTSITIESASAILKNFCDQHKMKIESWNSDDGVEVIASQGSQIATRLLGGWIVDPGNFPKRAIIRLSSTVDGTHIEAEIEEALGVGILDSIFKRRYQEYFQLWMYGLEIEFPRAADSKQP